MLTERTVNCAQSAETILDQVDLYRKEASLLARYEERAKIGQVFSPPSVARFLASLLPFKREIFLLDAGAGIGSLTAAYIDAAINKANKPTRISVTLYELDSQLLPFLKHTVRLCKAKCDEYDIEFSAEILIEDFIEASAEIINGNKQLPQKYNTVILNPPYKKLHSASKENRTLKSVGIETNNLYAAFISLSSHWLTKGGDIAAITPRSFCNGFLFREFRKDFLSTYSLRRLHVFDARDKVFKDDKILQEIIAFRAVKGGPNRFIEISSNNSPDDKTINKEIVGYSSVVRPGDKDQFIYIPLSRENPEIELLEHLSSSITDLGITVSTGRVVDFRTRDYLLRQHESNCIPLIYPKHFSNGIIEWNQNEQEDFNAIRFDSSILQRSLPSGYYVLIKRFSTKDQPRRVVAALFDPKIVNSSRVSFENRLNFLHKNGNGLPEYLAKGLVIFLNSKLVDFSFRQFNGHTQINANDLKHIIYPSDNQLKTMAMHFDEIRGSLKDIDALVDEVISSTKS